MVMNSAIFNQANKVKTAVLKDHFEKNKKESNMSDFAIYGLYIEMINKSESVLFLIKNNKTAGVSSLCRSVFEIHVYLKFILERDSKKRGESFLLRTKLDEVKMMKTIISDTKEGRETRELMEVSLEEATNNLKSKYTDEKINEWKIKYKNIHKGGTPSKWYDFDRKTNSFYTLCKKTGNVGAYNTIFRLLSQDTHSVDVIDNFYLEENFVAVLDSKGDKEYLKILIEKFIFDSMLEVLDFYKMKDTKKMVMINLRLHYKVQTGSFF